MVHREEYPPWEQQEDTHLRINNGRDTPTSGSTTEEIHPPWEQEHYTHHGSRSSTPTMCITGE